MLRNMSRPAARKEDFIKVYNAYNLELKKDGKMDFDDILRECYLLLCENHTILEQWRSCISIF